MSVEVDNVSAKAVSDPV